jgi:hypothetical protein
MPASSTGAKSAVPAARSPWLTAALAWFVPGSGHFLLGRRGRAVIVFVTVLIPFVIGLLMRGTMFQPTAAGDVLSRLIQWGGLIGDLAVGLPYFLAVWLGYAPPDTASHNTDYGSKLLVAAGLLNILAAVDAYEIATHQKD